MVAKYAGRRAEMPQKTPRAGTGPVSRCGIIICRLPPTARGNLVGVLTDGTAVLGLSNIGPLAPKPVMEGKGVLFKKFADIDVFDIEIAEQDPDLLSEVIAALEPRSAASIWRTSRRPAWLAARLVA
jgi:hypothetical protein